MPTNNETQDTETQETTYQPISVVITVFNDKTGCATTLNAMVAQNDPPDEIILVDGGSTDGTREMVLKMAERLKSLRVIDAPGANIAEGRNIGTRHASHEWIATTDGGCVASTNWIREIRQAAADPDVEFIAGTYRVTPRNLFEQIIASTTMRGYLEPIDPGSFNPSARSLAYRKSLWERAGGWPEWIRYSEDTLWDKKIRAMGVKQLFCRDAVVDWRPRKTWRGLSKQFYNYGTGRGQTQMGAENFRYNIRNFLLLFASLLLGISNPWAFPFAAVIFAYFYVYAFHPRAWRIVNKTQTVHAYPLTMAILWVIQVTHTTGYLVGTWQRMRNKERFAVQTAEYLSVST
ncbi:MAG: glycosyltransferase [Phycisphaerae bacterium]